MAKRNYRNRKSRKKAPLEEVVQEREEAVQALLRSFDVQIDASEVPPASK